MVSNQQILVPFILGKPHNLSISRLSTKYSIHSRQRVCIESCLYLALGTLLISPRGDGIFGYGRPGKSGIKFQITNMVRHSIIVNVVATVRITNWMLKQHPCDMVPLKHDQIAPNTRNRHPIARLCGRTMRWGVFVLEYMVCNLPY